MPEKTETLEDIVKSVLNYCLAYLDTDLRNITYNYYEMLNEAIEIGRRLKVPRRMDVVKNFISAYLRVKLGLPASKVDLVASSSKGRRLWEQKIRPVMEELERERKEREELMEKVRSNYYEALKRAWRKYWGRFPPWYAPLENLAPLIEEELSKIIGRHVKLPFEEHVQRIDSLFKQRKVKDYYIGGIDPKRRHWILLKEEAKWEEGSYCYSC